MRRRITWKPGQSGKPLDGGLLVKRQNEARKALYDELCAAFVGEFPNPTPFELALISSAADLLPVRWGSHFFVGRDGGVVGTTVTNTVYESARWV